MNPFETQGEDSSSDSPIQKIIRGAFGIPLVLDSAPTTVGGQLPNHGDNGFFGINWYVNMNGTVLKFVGVSV